MNILTTFVKNLNLQPECERRLLNEIQNCQTQENLTQNIQKKASILVENPLSQFSNHSFIVFFLHVLCLFVCLCLFRSDFCLFFICVKLQKETVSRECQNALQYLTCSQSIIKIQAYIRSWTVLSDFKKLRMCNLI
jgi:hypothetical protein